MGGKYPLSPMACGHMFCPIWLRTRPLSSSFNFNFNLIYFDMDNDE
jgi:hypothetical protein